MTARSGARLFACAGIVLALASLQGCASLYLHSSTVETATQAARDDVTKIKLDKTFSDAKAKLDGFAIEEEAGIAAYLVAARNGEIANLVRRNLLDTSREANSPQGPVSALSGHITDRANAILGTAAGGPSTAQKLADPQLAVLPDSIDLINESLEVERRNYLGALRTFTARAGDKDQRPTDCDKALTATTSSNPEADIAYERIVEACAEIRDQTRNLAQAKAILDPQAGSQLAEVLDKSKRAAALVTAQTAEAGRLEAAIKKLKADPPSDLKDLDAEIKKIRELLDKAQGIAAVAGADEVSTVLEDLLAADLAKPPAEPSKLTAGTLSVLKLTRALAQASDAFSSQSQVVRVNSTLLAIAELRQKSDMAKLTVAQQRTNLQIYGAQEMALIRELALLSIAQRIATRTLTKASFSDGFASVTGSAAKQGTGAALAAYVDSWNQGRIPYRVLQFREVQVERSFIVQRASKTASNWAAVLTPPLDDLVAYGKGGIHPETIATIITNLGIMGAIIGK